MFYVKQAREHKSGVVDVLRWDLEVRPPQAHVWLECLAIVSE